jgi:hypothetical protein
MEPDVLDRGGPGRHRRGPKEYGLHFTGVTSSEFPLLELIQPAAVRLQGQLIAYGLPRPSVTCSATSSSNGALSIGLQLFSGGSRIALFQFELWRQHQPKPTGSPRRLSSVKDAGAPSA